MNPFNNISISADIIYYDQLGTTDKVSGNEMTSTALSSTDVFDPTTLGTTRFEAHEVACIDNEIICQQGITQLCPNSENPSYWKSRFASAKATGVTKGCFNEADLVLSGINTSGVIMWDSTEQGSPDGRLYFSFFYGGSATIYLRCDDDSNASTTLFYGSPGSLSIFQQDVAANIAIESQTYLSSLGVYVLKGSVLFNVLGNALSLSITGTSESTDTIKLYGFDLSNDSDIWNRHISNNSVLGPEINDGDAWGLTNVTQDGSRLTFDASVEDAIAQLALSDEFISGEIYQITADIISQDDLHSLRLGTGESGFVSVTTTIYSYSTGHINLRATCGVAGGRLRILIPHAYYTGTVVVENISCRKIKSNIRVVSSRKNTISNWFGPADGSEDIIDGTMEGSAAVWFNFGTPAVNVRSSEQAHSGTYSRKIQNITEAGLRTSMFTTVTGELRKVHLWVYPVDNVRTLAVAVRCGDDSNWAMSKAVNQYGLIAGQWNEIAHWYTETAGGAGAYLIVYDTGTNANRYYVDDISVKTISKTTLETAYPAFYKSCGGSILGPEMNGSDNWGLTNVTKSGTRLTFDATNSDAIAQLPLDPEFYENGLYRVGFDVVSQDYANSVRIGSGESGFTGTTVDIASLVTANSVFTEQVCTVEGGRLRLLVPNAFYPGEAIIENISCKRVEKSNGQLSFTWTPEQAYTESIEGSILYSGFFYLRHTTDGNITLTDGTNTATVTGVNWAAGEEIEISAIYGPDYNSAGACKMILMVNGSSSAKTDLIPRFTFGNFMTWTNTDLNSKIKNLKIAKLKQSIW